MLLIGEPEKYQATSRTSGLDLKPDIHVGISSF
jgi:hypothetical protein